MKAGDIILLNGTSSSGKSSIAAAIQEKSDRPFLHIGIDTFIMALPAGYWDTATTLEAAKTDPTVRQGFHFVMPDTPQNPTSWPIVGCGLVADKTIQAMHAAIHGIVLTGLDVIVDHVFLRREWFQDFLDKTEGVDTLKVKIHCSREELDRRENSRGNRMKGLAWAHQGFIHHDIDYDLSLDTEARSPAECAREILGRVSWERS